MGSIPVLGRSPGGRHGNPLHYSCLENPMDRGVWSATVHGVSESGTTEHTLLTVFFKYILSFKSYHKYGIITVFESKMSRSIYYALMTSIVNTNKKLHTSFHLALRATLPMDVIIPF